MCRAAAEGAASTDPDFRHATSRRHQARETAPQHSAQRGRRPLRLHGVRLWTDLTLRSLDRIISTLDFVISTVVPPCVALHLAIEEKPVGWPVGGAWVFLGIPIHLPFRSARPVYLPLVLRLWGTRQLEQRERLSKPELARELIYLMAARHPRRRLHVVADARYASRTLRGLPANVTFTVKMRSNAVIYASPPPKTGRRGRPRRRGARLGTLTELAAPGGFGQVKTAAGTSEVKPIVGQWYSVFADQAVQILLARRPGSPRPFDIAIVSTDVDASVAELLERYWSRWRHER